LRNVWRPRRLRPQKPQQQHANKQLAIVEREISNIMSATKAGIVTARRDRPSADV
jgi:hypothetical protein